MSPIRLTLAAVAVAAVLSPLAAAALEARASGNAPVRTGPAPYYPVVAHLYDGEYYEVLDCTRQKIWCLVGDEYGAIGWVRGSQIVGEAAKNRVAPFEFMVNPHILKLP